MEYKSILKEELNGYLQLRITSGKYVKHTIYIFNSLDQFLCQNNVSEKVLTEEILTTWYKNLSIKPITKKRNLLVVRDFVKYLNSLGYVAFIPEIPRASSDYVPYIFSNDEWIRIIDACDNLVCNHSYSNTPVAFPMLIRMLYGCGLRLGEALSLRMQDVDLNNGILLIRHAKGNKQRFVPMSKSLTEVCWDYCQSKDLGLVENDYLFMNHYRRPYSISWSERWFKIILEQAGIGYTRTSGHERGPCLHCLRHTFVFRSFAKAEADGRSLDDSVPFLSTYLGHENITETDKYLKFSYELYPDAHKRISQYTNDLFPEVDEK